ncbi:hypothetical protein EK904_005640 [Melospiza melodia maxima]|nr:hypothetical protein EK904_005640 [Melospiza melodia maxima]
MKLRDLMEAAYRFLQKEPSVFQELWDWSVCVPLLRSHDTLVRWLLEESQLQNVEQALVLANPDSSFWQKEKEPHYTQGHVVSGDLSARVVAVCGVVLPRLQHVSEEQTLLGMYRCTDVPGEFVWQPGTLTQAVTKGHWILLEDIDYAPLDVISVLIPLLEKRELLIPGRGDCLKVAPGFQFFATRRIFSCGGGWYRQQSSHAALLDKYWTKIHLDNMSKGELKEILQRRYPNLALVTDHLLDIFIDLAGDKYQAPENSAAGSSHVPEATSESRSEHKKPSLEGRELSLRDLLNWCSRIACNFDSNSSTTAVNIFQEVEFFCELYKPEISIREQDVSVGRVNLVKKQNQALTLQRAKHTFAATRPSAVLIEQLAVSVVKGEPVLLVGETGTGKTSAVQYLAHITGHRLRVVNMNQQSDTADLLGGYKPVDNKLIWLPLRESFEELFYQTFSRKKNQTFLGHIQTCYRQKRWHDLLKLMQHIHKSAINKEVKENASGLPLKEKWEAFGLKLNHAHQQMKMTENALLFAFVEGTLAQAVKNGEWILLDEINLAAAETLECLSGLLEGSSGSLVLLDRGDTEPLVRHPDFRLFACMNPATDVGKRNLPLGIRNRFTELYVEELRNEGDLQILIMDYLRSLNVSRNTVQGIVNFYLSVRKEAETKLVDGTGHRPHYSLRTLCRALRFAASNPCGSIARSLYEQIPKPKGGSFILIEGYWISAGDKEPTVDESYVLTPSVKLNLKDIVRVVSAGTHPVLIQGETSVGKTSLIRWLAAATGNHCVRINNHEHTDIQEYIGCYTSDASGKLVFKEGILIDAMRKGYWIVLDELNLAPTDVLEALNRLLDDNRELFITETQEVVKAHPRFMLFATQNPPGLYGGRKVLSRAFRNRFVELHFDELPSAELETILHKRCSLPPSYCSKLVKVMLDLQSYRRGSTVFAGKHGFITLRDLFRWAERYRLAEQLQKEYDWLQHLANDGFMLLAGRVRKQEEVDVIQNVIEKHFKKKIYPESLFSGESVKKLLAKSSTWMSVMDRDFSHVVWTQGMRRLAILVGRALEFGEPVLLVGDTGCGKTTICQIFAALADQKLYSVNCHLHMETSDFLGGLRPVRQRAKEQEESEGSRLFEWCDGPLVLAMKEEGFFLLDEISLADDSVLERLNSVLEAEKTLVLAEKGGQDDEENEVELLVAGKKFRILATMNPGGDFGKKELSPALRNRFTEIWCPQSNGREDLIQIVKHNLHPGLSLGAVKHKGADIAELMMDFVEWLTNQEFGRQCILSVRDILAWVNFMNVMAEDESSSAKGCSHRNISPWMSFIHAACLVYIDGLGSGPVLQRNNMTDYALNAGTTAVNAQRLLRALQLNKPILLEGSPGVGKTSLVAALAKASGNCLVRINLSEQTDVTDLFGTDLPVEGGKGGEFAWRDGPLLAALKAGHWIVLDELNLASQSVLEGLNACFDHRAEIYVPELGMNFHVQHKTTKIFGCQNPYRQGGGRKGLPKSFLNRFTQVYVDPLSAEDMKFIGNTLFPAIDKTIIAKMVAFNNKIEKEVMAEKKWGQKGGPWEFNLRDLFRWCQLMLVDQSPGCYDPGQHVFLVYGERMRTREDKEKVISVYRDIFGQEASVYTGTREFHINPYNVQIGYSVLSRGNYIPHSGRTLSLLHHSLQSLESVMKCVHMSWMVILVGPAAVGKTSLVELLAHLTGHRLKIMAMNSAMDTTELLGGFEQVDINRPWQRLLAKVESAVSTLVRDSLLLAELCADDAELVLRAWSNFILNCKPKSLGEGGGSVTAELVSKLEGILVLIQRLNNKISSYTKAEFAHLVEEFRRFKLQQAQAADCNSHGTFEWVDGMLVQALQSGDWLLMDNVNFCNPSVLDRLNALLEPGGVLTMSERGVIDGTIPTIAPHPNFRLFLSMDPVHGEISRAMRNRGIEIYVPGENDGNVLDSLDLKLLLHGLGLVGDNVCDALLAVHSETKEAIADEHVMPLDPRWNMQLLEIIRNSMNFDTEMEHTDQLLMLLKSAANRAVLFLDREKRSYLEKSLIASKKPRNSALRMSLDFHKNPGSYNCLPHVVVVNLAAFFELWDTFVLHWVKSTQVALSDDDTHDVLCCSLWRDRLWAISDSVTVDAPGLSLLALHWHWVMKHLIARIPQMLIGSDQSKISREIQSISQQIQSCLVNPAGNSANMKILQKSLGRPLPFKDKLGMECFSQLKALSKPLNILELRLACGDSRWQEKMCCVKIATTGVKMKKALLQADGLIIRASHLEDVSLGQLQLFLKAVHSQLKAEGVKYSYSEERLPEDTISNQLDPALLGQLCSQVQLWPAMEYIGVLWQYKLTADYVAKACARRHTDARLQGIMLGRLLSALVDLIPVDLQEEFLECCEKLYLKDPVAYEYLLKILESITDQELLPKEFLFLLLTCLHQFYGEGLQELPETAWRGSLWVSIGLVQIQMWIPQTRFDPAVKREYKLKYSKEEEAHQYISSIAQVSSVQDLLARLLQFLRGERPKSLQAVQNLLNEEASWQQSHHQFRRRLAEEYAVFPDAIVPLQAAIVQLQHGMRLVASEASAVLQSSVCPADLSNLLTSLLAFPSVGRAFPTYFARAEIVCSVNSVGVLNGLKKFSLKHSEGGSEGAEQPSPTLEQLLAIVNEWDEQERRAQEQEAMEHSLYRYRSKSHGKGRSEEEEEEEEFRRRFPFHEKDFEDITAQPSLEEKMETEDPVEDQLEVDRALLSKSSMQTVMKEVTSDLVLQQDGPYDFYQHPNIQQVRQCQPVLDNFAKEINGLLQEWPEHPVLVQLLVVMDRIRSFPLSSPLSKFLNGLEILLAKAQDWEENASRALSLRKHLDLVTQLIIQWRRLELNCWSVSLDNIMKQHVEKSTKRWFSIYQMIEKYVQEQTEANTEGTEQMDLKTLVSTLQAFIEGSTLGEFQARLQTLLVFHCHVLLMPQGAERDVLCSILWNLYNYYKQFSECVEAKITELRQPIEKELKEFVKISRWNDVSFWAIKQSVEKIRRTLFKFMKKFEVVLDEPCQPALVEIGKEEQLDCMQKQEESEDKETKIQRLNNTLRKVLSARTDVTKKALPECQGVITFHTDSLQYRLSKLTKKMKKMCTSVTENNSFLNLVENLDQFTGGIIVSVAELQNLTFDQTATKEKQKSEAKHIQMQKQRALSDLFKSLAKTGLSYRRGLSWSRSEDCREVLYLRPLDVRSALAAVDCTQELDTTLLTEISSAWDGCQKYFYRSLARHSRLQTALLAPAKDIGLGSIERCKGFTAHLMQMLVRQRRSLTALTEQWILLRNLLSCIQEIDSRLTAGRDYNAAFPPQDSVQCWTDRLQQLCMQCVMALEELSWFLQCCPKEESARSSDSERSHVKPNVAQSSVPEMGDVLAGIPDLIPSDLKHLSPVSAEQLPPGCRMRNKDQLWLQVATQLTAMIANVKAVKAEVDRVRQQSRETSFYSWKDFEVCTSAVSCLLEVSAQLQSIESLFLPNGQDMEAANQIALIKSLKYIQEEVNNTSSHFTAWRTQLLAPVSNCTGNQQSDEEFVEQFSTKVETVIHAVLYAVQCLVERKQEGGKEEEKSSEENEDAALLDVIKAGHITKLLDQDLSADLEALHVQKAILGVSELLEILKSYREDCTSYKHKFFNQSCYLLVRLKPMLCKYSDLILFYLTISLASHRSTGKLLSVLTSIFTELALKGFCLPKELLEEEAGEGATEFHDYEDGGIGEGEGKKDIEDSYQKGKEKEKEDQDSKPDIEGEDNAIEMSEDFEGKMHDGELEKNEDEENSDEEEELDKQMGNLDNAEADDKLDERLWGDDEDDDDDEDASSKTEETGPGMDEEDSELVAKDDNLGTGNKDNKKKPPKNEEKEQQEEDSGNKEKIHEQIDEREYDDNEVDPYHGQQEKEPEIEPLDLPDNLNLESNEKSDDEEEEEEENDFEIDEKPMDLNEAEKKEEQNAEDTGETEGDDQDAKAAEEGISEDKEEKEDEGDKDQDHDQEEKAENTEDAQEEEEESQPPDEKKNESAEDKGIPNEDQGLQPQESGTGASSANQSEGHESTRMARMASQKQSIKNTQSFKRKPGQADNERSMGDHNERIHKRLRTMESSSEAKQDAAQPKQNVEEADAFEHIKQSSEHYDAQTYDVASKEQEKPFMPPEEKEEGDFEDAAMETEMEDEDLRAVDTEELKPEKKKSNATKPSGPSDMEPELQTFESEDVSDSAPEKLPKVAEEKPERSKDSTIHTAHQFLMDIPQEKEAAQLWQKYLVLTAPLSQQLCEQLRLILEPTQAAKLKGDYRTGKRLNMRKVIPYIASQFRKDKIWLRRAKPSKRQYQICLAIDDSSSMIDNHSKQLAYESLAVIGNALTLLEVGQIAVCSFGETVQLLHPFHEQFSDQSGTRILRLCKFQQKKTKIAQFLESSANMFAAAQQLSQNINPETAQLLLIVSDGRGLFLEGKERVTAAVQAARSANIFVIFVVLDNPNSRDSILDIKVPIFKGPGELPEIRSYMEEFPFPFYMILRDVNALPETLSDALRQWFELFLRRQQVLQLYRKILRAIREVPAEQDRRYLRDWAREEFKRNKDATEEDAIRMMITQGNMQLQELQRTLKLAKS